MADPHSERQLDSRLTSLLGQLRSQVRRYIVWDSLLAILAVLLSAFWLGLLFDYVPVLLGGTEMPRSARVVLLLGVAVVIAYLVVKLLVGRLNRSLPDDSLALLLERHHPELGGSLITTVQLHAPSRQGDAHTPEMLQRVGEQAVARIGDVQLGKVFRWQPIQHKVMLVAPLLLAVLVLLIARPHVFQQGAARLLLLTDAAWPRQADLQMVGMEIPRVTALDDDSEAAKSIAFENKIARLPRGANANLRIQARADGAVVPDNCTLYYRTADGARGQANMRRVGRVVDGMQDFVLDGPPLSGIAGDLTFSVRGLDDRLDGYKIEIVPPPAVTSLQILAQSPPYLRADREGTSADLTTEYQPGLRLREGADVTLVATSSKPLSGTEVAITVGDEVVVNPIVEFAEDDLSFRFTIHDLRQSTKVVVVPIDKEGLTSQTPFRYFLGVINDNPPEIEMRLKGIDLAVTKMANIPLRGTITDDYGITTSEVSVVEVSDQETQTQPTTMPISIDREGVFAAEIDLRSLVDSGRLTPLQPGSAINVFAETSDAYDLGPPHLARSEVYRLQIVTPDELLAMLERRELGLRARLEQAINETRSLRDTLDLLRREGWSDTSTDTPERAEQVLRLRIQQTALQTTKTSEELQGLASGVENILEEMVNNRVDSPDRRSRLSAAVAQPLRKVISGPLELLGEQITGIEERIADPSTGQDQTALAVATADQTLLDLTAILEKMLDLESYNEILDLVRSLIEAQEGLIEDTEQERTERIRNLFNE
ncbi:hypothetical protein FF011L_21270 [Roseimaritima multifibrata]|uniref:Polyketide synthase n=1 Tax=Roseimaritima multifibrata TaxID=1930274 RepID=A0A517MEP2_9BACT|nr:polyketide synthase [Roseimaritima multifibrata]QDS93364.1 hypothetical protein FF011L_21270 [Roseimaritima multifibrata]